jgi:heterodisulfide reductase subunit A-like polyferredoxin
VCLVERSPFLGGQVSRLHSIAPTGEKATDLIDALAGQVIAHPSITVLTCAQVTAFGGYIGNFTLPLNNTARRCRNRRPTEPNQQNKSRIRASTIPFAGMLPARRRPNPRRPWRPA